MEIYTVQAGDTLTSIARKKGLSAELLQRENMLSNPESLVAGQDILILRPEVTHTVKAGETLSSIAREYGTTANAILRNNPTADADALIPGTELVISYEGVNPSRRIIMNGYTYPGIERDRLKRILPYLTFLTIFTYGFTNNGDLIAPDDIELIELALSYGTAPVMLVSTLTENGTFSNQLADMLLGSSELQQRLINNIIRTMEEKGYKALDIDFEFLPAERRESYIAFMAELTERLNAKGMYTLIALAPKTSSAQTGLLYEAHDYYGLGRASNFSLLMTYEWGYTYGPPLPVAPLPNVEAVISYGVSEIPPQKILMGIPLYGYDWRLPYVKGTMARSISPVEAVEIALKYRTDIQYDDYRQAPFFYYTHDGIQHVVWFENMRSINAKLDIAENYGLAGMGLWNIIREFPQFYMLVNSRFIIERV